jgi:hypothetical protein
MIKTLSAQLAYSAAVTLITLGSASPSLAQTVPCPAIQLDAGVACAGFALGIDVFPPDKRVERTFVDKDGHIVRTLSAGKGNTLVFSRFEIINSESNQCRLMSTFSLKSNGSVESISCCTDNGEQIRTATGHNVLVLFPGDTSPSNVPAAPSTNLYVGRLVFLQKGDFTAVQSFNGSVTDICAALPK